MKKSSLTFIFNLFFISQLLSVNSQTDSCNTTLNFNDLLNFDLTSFSCQSVWQEEDFILRYDNANANTWSFLLSAPNTGGYVAMGFSNNTDSPMIGASAMVGWPWRENGSTGKIKQYYLGGTSASQVKPDQGNLNVVNKSVAVFVQSSRIYLAFQLTTSQISDNLIFAVGSRSFQPRSPNFLLQEHQNKVATQINYASGKVETQDSPYAGLRKDHGVVNILAWGILVPFGSLTARYFRRWDPIWFYSHVAIQIIGFILGLTGIILGFVLQSFLNLGDTISNHKGIGITILVFGCLQVTALLARPEKGSKARKYWNWYHHFAGRFIILLSIINIFYGLRLAEEGVGWSIFYGFILVIMIIGGVFGEIKLRRQN